MRARRATSPIATSATSRVVRVRWMPLIAATIFDPTKNGMMAQSALVNPVCKRSIVGWSMPRYLMKIASIRSPYARPARWQTAKARAIRRLPMTQYATPLISVPRASARYLFREERARSVSGDDRTRRAQVTAAMFVHTTRAMNAAIDIGAQRGRRADVSGGVAFTP